MKKRKTYEVSVINKTYSKTYSDQTKFYTSDTALELSFQLKEVEYDFDSAEIILLNVDDRSLITRPVAKNADGFSYEIEDDIVEHYGEWKGQLKFNEGGEIYVSSPVSFRIENDLNNDRPPQLSDVQSWVSLKRYADKLTEELKQAVLSVEGIEGTFNENELERQSQFETSEQSRQTTFEMAENERDETFESNETTRQSQELEREKAEGTRQTVFDDNEASRDETFNTNEVTRQENENARQQAESQRQSTFETNESERQTTFETAEQERQSAELIRVENESQRKIDHENRSAELAGKADKVVLKNEIENGDFSNGTKGWNTYQSYISVANNGSLKVESDRNNANTQTWRDVYLKPMSKYYLIAELYAGNKYKMPSVVDFFAGGVTSSEGIYGVMKENTSEEILSARLKFTMQSSQGDYYYIDNVQLINLTTTFVAGNEPTREEMDELIKITGYIDGEYALNNKEFLIWTLALIRRNKNAIVALGGA